MKTIVISLSVALSTLANAQQIDGRFAESNRQVSINQSKNAGNMEQAKQVVNDFLMAVQQHDGEKMTALLHPNVTWSQPGKNRFAGQKRSREEVFQMAGGMQEVAAKTLTLSAVKTLSVNGNQVACLVHWQAAQPNGGVLNVDNIDVYTVKDGQIVNALVFSADIVQEDNFWLH
jgi:hypothetical protein